MPATIEIPTTRPGRTLTLSAFPDGSDTAAFTGESLTEAGNRPGLYAYSNATATGLHLLILYDSSTPIWQAWAVLNTEGTVTASESREAALLAQSINSSGQVAVSIGESEAEQLATAILEGMGIPEGQRVATPEDLHVVVGPVSARVPSDVIQNTIHLRLDDTSEYRIEQITGVDGQAVDLTAFDQLELLLETRDKQQLEVLPVTVINDGAGFSFQPTTATVGVETQAQSPHLWALRNPLDVGETGTGRVICGGPLVVTRFATRRGEE